MTVHSHPRIIFIALFLLVSAQAFGSVIRGVVYDQKTKEPVIGATVKIAGSAKGAKSRLDGSYQISDVADGNITLHVHATGYIDADTSVVIAGADVALDIAISYKTYKGEELTVTGKAENGSEIESQNTERFSDNVINSVAARSIEVSPDLSVADVTQRVSGVTITRTTTGDAQYAIIRGMDKRYNYTTVNGIKIPSPDNRDRYVPLDIFPSGLLDRLEVTKTLTPTMEGDAAGGVMNLVMKQSPDHEIINVDVGSGYNGLFGTGQKFYGFTQDNAQSPRIANGPSYLAKISDFPSGTWTPSQVNTLLPAYLSATYGNRYGDNQQLGVIVAGSYQNSYRGANTLFFQSDINQITGHPSLIDFQNRQYSTQQTRTGGMANIDYRADENNNFQLFGMYTSLRKDELRNMFDTVNQKGTWPQNPEVDWTIRATNETQNIGNVTLSGTDAIFGKDLTADWHLAYSSAVLNDPDEAHLSLLGGVNYTSNPPNVEPYRVDDSKRIWQNSTDLDKSVYLTLKTIEDLFGTTTEFSYGGMYRTKTRTATYDAYNLRVYNGAEYYNGNINQDSFVVYNPGGTPTDPLNYDAHENVTAGFIQLKFPISALQVVGGVRIERTDFGWTSSEPPTLAGKTGSESYIDMLPSINLKYSPTDNQNWRASYFKSISRPNFYEVIPSLGVPGNDYTEVSNDSLTRTQIDNVDLRWEFFPGGLDQLLVGVFYKRLQDPIEWVVENIQVSTQLQPQNLGTATNYGFEIDFRKFFSNFGIQGNYTYTNSQITTLKQHSNYVTGVGVVFDSAKQTRPLEGQAGNIGNLSFLYKNFESGTDAQISAVYTGSAIVGVSPYVNNDIWQVPYVQVDLSGEQRIMGNLSVYVKITNLFNSPREEEIHQPYLNSDYPQPIGFQTNGQNLLIRRELYDRTYILGIRLKM